MNDEAAEHDFDDPAHDEIRALLAGAAAVGPIPDDIARRLDDALAELTGSAPDSGSADVVPLRRRPAGRLLVAAAAVLVLGGGAIGLGQVLGSGPATTGQTASNATSGLALPVPPPGGTPKGLDAVTGPALPRLSTAHFAADAARLNLARFAPAATPAHDLSLQRSPAGVSQLGGKVVATPSPATAGSAGSLTAIPPDTSPAPPPQPSGPSGLQPGGAPNTASPMTSGPSGPGASGATCTGPARPGTTNVTVLLDGLPAALVVYPAAHGSRLVEAWSCDGRTRLAAARVPA